VRTSHVSRTSASSINGWAALAAMMAPSPPRVFEEREPALADCCAAIVRQDGLDAGGQLDGRDPLQDAQDIQRVFVVGPCCAPPLTDLEELRDKERTRSRDLCRNTSWIRFRFQRPNLHLNLVYEHTLHAIHFPCGVGVMPWEARSASPPPWADRARHEEVDLDVDLAGLSGVLFGLLHADTAAAHVDKAAVCERLLERGDLVE